MLQTLILVLLLASLGTSPDHEKVEYGEFIQLFAVTCMANVFSPEDLREALSTDGYPELTSEQEVPFLRGTPGTAWTIHRGLNRYVVSITDDGLCSVFARHADVDLVQQGFDRLVATAAEPMRSRELQAIESGPKTDDLTSTGYAWYREGENLDIVFLLTTSKMAVDPPIQALASAGLVWRSP